MSWLTGGSKSETKPQDLTPDAFKNLQQPFADLLQKLLGTKAGGGNAMLKGIPEYTGKLSAPITAQEQAGLARLQGYNNPGGMSTEAEGLLSKTMRGDFLPGQAGQNPFMDAAVASAQRQNLQGLQETLTRSLPGRFTQAGQFTQPGGSSAFDRAAALATRGVADANADIATDMNFQGYNAERERQQGAVGLQQAQVSTTISNLQAQALPRLIEQYGIEQGLAHFQDRVQALLSILGVVAGSTTPTIASSTSSRSNNGLLPALAGLMPTNPGGNA